jgi:hypothetical protein
MPARKIIFYRRISSRNAASSHDETTAGRAAVSRRGRPLRAMRDCLGAVANDEKPANASPPALFFRA